jgi:carbonic anhydrase/acetyltransferase-like protein (isoleucine patch superfamily)
MIRSFCGKMAMIAESACISDSACIIGDVEIGEESSVWTGAVIRSDCGKLLPGRNTRIGRNTHVEENAVVHCTSSIGNNVVIGHGAVVEAFRIGDNVLIGSNATVLAASEIGSFCIVAAGSVVPEGMRIPDKSFVAGIPAKIKGEVTARQLQYMQETCYNLAVLLKDYRAAGETI